MEHLFRECKVTGMKIKYTPLAIVDTGGAAVSNGPLHVASYVKLLENPTVQGMVERQDYKSYKGNSSFHRFYHVAKYADSIGSSYVPTIDLGDDDVAHTTILMEDPSGYALGSTMGYVQVSWYVRFRARDS